MARNQKAGNRPGHSPLLFHNDLCISDRILPQGERRVKSGESWEVSRKEGERVFVIRDGVQKVLPLQQWKTFNVYRRDTMPVAIGEHLLITKNNRGANLRNGELRKVAAIDGDRITLDNGRQLLMQGITRSPGIHRHEPDIQES
jgi:hypothetical protein